MRNIVKDIEQLEVAGDLIDKKTPTSSRLALFLIDNFAELVMHKICLYEFARDDQWKNMKQCKYSAKKRNDLKNHFQSKINFIVNDLNLIDDSDANVLRVGHALRNEAYHNGILRERIITPITRTYFQAICFIFPKLWLGSYGYTRPDEVREFLERYGIHGDLITSSALNQICEKILNGRGSKERDLSRAISEDLVSRIQDIIDAIDYLSSEPGAMSPDEGLKWLQFREEGGMEFGQSKNDEEFRQFWDEVKTKLAAFKPKVSLNTLRNWIKKAKKIESENDKGLILQKFWEIDKQFIKIENMVQEEVFRYDEYINSRIHS